MLAWLHRAPVVPPDVHVLAAAELLPGSDAPPAPDARGVPRALPDDWRRTGEGRLGGWYRLRFTVGDEHGVPWGVYLPAVSMNAAAFVDGELVGDGGRLAAPVARNWRRPLLFPIPAPRLAPGPHVLDVRVVADRPDTGLLGPVAVGPLARLAPLHARREALTTEWVWVITLCLVIAGAFTGALWLQWRDPTYGWFAATALAWAVLHLGFLVVEIPIASATWDGLWYLAVVAWVVALVRFFLAFTAVGDPRLARAVERLAAVGAVAIAALTISGSPWLHAAARFWAVAAFPAVFVGAWQMLALLWTRDGDLGDVLPSVLALTVATIVAHDWLVFVGLAGPTYDYFIAYAAPPVFLGMAWALLRRFVGTLAANAALVADLERCVDAERAALAASYERLRDVERARVLAEERERIMREMHDGLGSHLVSTLALLDREDVARDTVAQAVRAALDDLRLMIEALVPLDGDLVGALAMLRARLQPRLEAAGIRVEWRVSDLPRIATLGQRTVLQVLRILQEAVTNVLKHAGARTLTVETRADDSGARPSVAVEIADDGRGLDAAAPGGRGLPSMHRRAADIGAFLAVERAVRGTRVRLSIPLDA